MHRGADATPPWNSIDRHLDEVQFINFRHKVYVSAKALSNNMQIQISDVESSMFFRHSGGSAQRKIARHWPSLHSQNPTACIPMVRWSFLRAGFRLIPTMFMFP
jgi:hypothetical protein